MKNSLKDIFWIGANYFGYFFGFRFLAPLHYLIASLALHGLGYDNRYHISLTGEDWFIKKVLSRANIAGSIDIGANVGDYSAMLTRYTKGPIYAIEPLSSSFAALQQNASDRVRPFRLAITDFNGTATIYSRREQAQDATLGKDFLVGVAAIQEEIPVLTLDAFIEQNNIQGIDFIKIDTEGHEMEVFTGMQKMLHEAPPRFIQFEINFGHLQRGHTLYSFTQMLPGYRFYRLLPHGMLKIRPEKYIDNLFMFSNIIAERIK